MSTITTNTSATAWSPDQTEFVPGDVVPDALILATSTVASRTLDGDAPLVRVPYVDDDEATFVSEGAPVTEAAPTLAETTVATGKVAMLLRVSREQFRQDHTSGLLSESASRAVTVAGNKAYIAQEPPTAPDVTPPAGILEASGLIDGGEITGDLDGLVDLIATLEDNGSRPTHIVTAPSTWAELRKLKAGSGSNVSLLGAGTNDAERMLLDVPVLVSPAVPAGQGIVIDKTAIISAVGPVYVARSEHAFFGHDSIGLLVTWRFGATVMKPERIGTFHLDTDEG